MTPAQRRVVCGLIFMTQTELAAAAGKSTIMNFEKERRVVSDHAITAIRAALESAGIFLIDENGEGPGVRLRKE